MNSVSEYLDQLGHDFKKPFGTEESRTEFLKQIISTDKFQNVAQGILTGLIYTVGSIVGLALLSPLATIVQSLAFTVAIYFALRTYGAWDDEQLRIDHGIKALSATAFCLLPSLLSLAPIALIGLMLYRTFPEQINEAAKAAKPGFNKAVKYCKSFFEPKTAAQELTDKLEGLLP